MRKLSVVAILGLSLALGCDSKKDEKKADDKKAESKDAKKADDKKAEGGGGGDKIAAGDTKAADAKAEPAGDAKPEAAAAGGKLAIDKLNLTATAPAEASVGDGIGGSGVMVTGPGFAVNLEEASETRPKDVAAAKKDAEMYTPQNLKDEKLADGWALTFDNKGDMGANFFVNGRRDIGGKAFWCETMASTTEQQTAALDFCKSLAAK
ncbi:MAG TPA: hypothetical protein VG755_02440 [Nannocystaceae bacterium]|nr:hypothetical protein [Nannocystaceae bacterium]